MVIMTSPLPPFDAPSALAVNLPHDLFALTLFLFLLVFLGLLFLVFGIVHVNIIIVVINLGRRLLIPIATPRKWITCPAMEIRVATVATYSWGAQSCNGDGACGGRMNGTVGTGACNGDGACVGNKGDVGSGACNGDGACRNNAKTITPGTCNGDGACQGA
jgi:hypothetical protein